MNRCCMNMAVWGLLLVVAGCAASQRSTAPLPLAERAHQPLRLPPVAATAVALRPVPSEIQQIAHFEEVDPAQAEQLPPSASTEIFAGETSAKTLVGYALANNSQIAAARFQAEALMERVSQAGSLEDPVLRTTAFLEEIETAAGRQDVILSLSQKFPWFGKRALRGDVAYYNAMAAYRRLAVLELQTQRQIKDIYFQIYYLDRAIEVNQSLERWIKDVIDIVRTKYETNAKKTGLESVYQAQIELSKLRTILVQLSQTKRVAQARLTELLHLPPRTRLEIDPAIELTRVPGSVDVLLALLEQYQPELDAHQQEISRDDTATQLAMRNYLPDVTVGVNWYAIGSDGISPVANGDDAVSLSVGVNLPIYHQRLDAAVREAELKSARSSQQYEAAEDRLKAEVMALYARVTEHDQILRILEKDIIPRSKDSLDLSREALKVDRLGLQEVIEYYEDYLQYRLDFYQRQSLRQQAMAALEQAVGSAIATWPPDGADGEKASP